MSRDRSYTRGQMERAYRRARRLVDVRHGWRGEQPEEVRRRAVDRQPHRERRCSCDICLPAKLKRLKAWGDGLDELEAG